MCLKKFLQSFAHAGRGIAVSFNGRSMKIHLIATILVLIMSTLLPLTATEWIIILILIGAVWSSEIINTSLEDVCNHLRDQLKLEYSATRSARDLAAGAVLVWAIISLIIGLIIFLPKILVLSFIN